MIDCFFARSNNPRNVVGFFFSFHGSMLSWASCGLVSCRHCRCCFPHLWYELTVFPQMTARQQRAVWRWPTASPPWSRGSRCRRTRSSCWSLLWLMWCAGSMCQRNSRPWGRAGDPPKVAYAKMLLHAFFTCFPWVDKLSILFPSCSHFWLDAYLLFLCLSLIYSPGLCCAVKPVCASCV